MEGISHEACSWPAPGPWQAGRLLRRQRHLHRRRRRRLVHRRHPSSFRSLRLAGDDPTPFDGHDPKSLLKPPSGRQGRETARPTLICCKTIIGGSAQKKAATTATAPWRRRNRRHPRQSNWPHAPFEIPADIAPGNAKAPRAARSRMTGTASPPTAPPSRNSPPNSSAAWPANCRQLPTPPPRH